MMEDRRDQTRAAWGPADSQKHGETGPGARNLRVPRYRLNAAWNQAEFGRIRSQNLHRVSEKCPQSREENVRLCWSF